MFIDICYAHNLCYAISHEFGTRGIPMEAQTEVDETLYNIQRSCG